MKKQPCPVQYQEEEPIEDALALQENDVIAKLIYEYISSIKRKPASSRTDLRVKRIISQSIWPRLVAMRLRTVLVKLIPVINLVNHEYLIDGLNDAQWILAALGWALHGLRLIINILRFLNCYFSNNENTSTWQKRLEEEFKKSWVELGNDLLWVVTTLTPVIHITISLAFIMIELTWIVFCAWAEISRLNHFKHGFNQITFAGAIQPRILSAIDTCQDDLKKHLTYAQKKLMLSVITTLSSSLLMLLRTAIMPVLLPTLAINPFILFGFAFLALLITFASHFIGECLKNQKPSEKIVGVEKNTTIITASRFAFFKPPSEDCFKVKIQRRPTTPKIYF